MAGFRSPGFRGRSSERAVLDRLLENVRGGQSAVLVIRGEAGVGKTALLRYAARQAAGFRVAQIAGVESEMELPFAGLHQLCAPMLDRLDALPEPQRQALARRARARRRARRPTASSSRSPRSACWPRSRPSSRCCASSTTPSGSTAPRRRSSGSSRARLLAESVAIVFAVREPSRRARARRPARAAARRARRGGRARAARDGRPGPARRARPRPDRRRDARQPARAAGAAARHDGRRSCAGGFGRPGRAARSPGGSRRASCGGSTRCPRRRAPAAARRGRGARSATRCSCGAPPSGSGIGVWRRPRPRPRACSRSASG